MSTPCTGIEPSAVYETVWVLCHDGYVYSVHTSQRSAQAVVTANPACGWAIHAVPLIRG